MATVGSCDLRVFLTGYRPGQLGYAELHCFSRAASEALYEWLGLDSFAIERWRIAAVDAVEVADVVGVQLCSPGLVWELSSRFDDIGPVAPELIRRNGEADNWRRLVSHVKMLSGWGDPMATSMHPRLFFEAKDLSRETVLRPAGWTKWDAVRFLGKRYGGPGYYPITRLDAENISGCAPVAGEMGGAWYVVTR